MSAFIRLATLAGEMDRDDFKIHITSCLNISNAHAQNGFCQITLSVEDILNKTSIWFGDPMHELYCVLKVSLTNSSEYLATKSSISTEEINFFMQNKLALVIDDNDQLGFRLNGVEDRNQDRLDIAKFCLEVREKLAEDKRLLQTFIMAKMKCFDYFSATSSSLIPNFF